MTKVITVKTIEAFIKRRIRRGECINFLGFVENKELTSKAMALFKSGMMYNWVSGNQRMQRLIDKIVSEMQEEM